MLQWAGSVLVLTQAVPHRVVPPPQLRPHLPPEQTSPVLQLALQAPQLAGSRVMSTHWVPHLVVPPTQVVPHLLAEQTSPALQPLAQPPQL